MNNIPSLTELAPLLTDWFTQYAADLPWRKTTNPYHIWLSEMMLQQTQIDTVIPYYMRFLKNYPEVADLAKAPIDEILKQWEGLGYYSRARNLHKTAKTVAFEMNGVFPRTAIELQQLPGIGRYTAGAIASIAYGESAPLLDGNVIRVFARLLDLDADVTQNDVKSFLWRVAETWVPSDRPGDYNQALMELGQKICKPRNPLCKSCPTSSLCLAFANGTQTERPVKTKKTAIPHIDVVAGIIWNGDKILIAQRPMDGLLGGLWEFPGGKQELDETPPQCLQRELHEELAIEVRVQDLFVKVRHAFTHFKMTLYAYECHYLGATPPFTEPQKLQARDWAWVTLDEIERYGFGKADREVITALKKRGKMLL